MKSVAHLPWRAFMYKVSKLTMYLSFSVVSILVMNCACDSPPHRHCIVGICCHGNVEMYIFSIFQAFNTFIDDVFAFIITMPTTHRIAVFRDDLVFMVYLYQRWWVETLSHTHTHTHTHTHAHKCRHNSSAKVSHKHTLTHTNSKTQTHPTIRNYYNTMEIYWHRELLKSNNSLSTWMYLYLLLYNLM